MRQVMFGAILALALAGGARAEGEATLRDDAAPLVLVVRPSRIEESPEERRERLLRRAEERDYRFRSICRGCGPAAVSDPNAPFFPLDVLAQTPKAPSGPAE